MPYASPDNTLPSPLTSLIGREQNVASLRHLLIQDDNPVRLLTLTGAAGSGKTRLAIHLGAVLAGVYPDGVGWLVSRIIRHLRTHPERLKNCPILR
jgi:hypothetical protein